MTIEELLAENERLRETVRYCDKLHKHALRVFEEYRNWINKDKPCKNK